MSGPCRKCKTDVKVLHHDPDKPDECYRVICGKCQGDANRRIVDSLNPGPKKKDYGYRGE